MASVDPPHVLYSFPRPTFSLMETGFFVLGKKTLDQIQNEHNGFSRHNQINQTDVVNIVDEWKNVKENYGFLNLTKITNAHFFRLELLMDKEGVTCLFPRHLSIDDRTGWLYTIARNYSDGTTKDCEKLFTEFTKIVTKKISLLPSRWHDIEILLDDIRNYICTKKLTPSRTQVLSSQRWHSRFLICDNPQFDLKKITIPRETGAHPFPMKWLIEHFSNEGVSMRLGPTITHRPGNRTATIIDLLSADDNKPRDELFLDNRKTVINCLEEFGFDLEFLSTTETTNLCKLLRHCLGYQQPRKLYHEYFLEKSEKWDKHQMWADLELRLGEVFSIWIQSLSQIAGSNSIDDYITMINGAVTGGYEFRYSEPIDIGAVNIFIDLHKKNMDVNDNYKLRVQDRLPERMHRLMSEKARQMLEYLSIARNKSSHARPKEKKARKYDEEIYDKWSEYIDIKKPRSVRNALEEFYVEFFDIRKDMRVSSVPTLMEVIEYKETNHGRRAVLHCLRNGTTHSVSVYGNSSIQTFMAARKSKRDAVKLEMGDKLFVWATTNPALVDPLIFR